MKITLGNGFYFMYIAFAIIFILVLWLILRKKDKKVVRIVLLVILFLNFALHFVKQAFVPYINNQPSALSRSTLQNICAVSTVFCPFIYLIKKQNVLHDYMFFICMCGGLGGLFLPTEALNQMPFTFDVFRFYFCHVGMLTVVLLAAILGVYRPRLKFFWVIPLFFLLQEGIIAANECFLIQVGLVKCDYSALLDRGFRNSSFVFGIRPEFDAVKFMFDPLVPEFFKTDAFHINNGKPFYFPVLWLIVPALVYLIPIYIILSCPFWIQDLIKSKKLKTQSGKGDIIKI